MDRVHDPARGVRRRGALGQQRAHHHPAVGQRVHPQRLGRVVVLAAQQCVRQRPVQVHTGRADRPRVERCGVVLGRADRDRGLAGLRRDDVGLDVDRYQDPLVARQRRVPRLPRREVDVSTRERGEPLGEDRLLQDLRRQLELTCHQ
jgi:hypothetical protein